MLTVEKLKAYGANTEEALSRCFGKEAFYLQLVNMAYGDQNYAKLEESLKAKDLDAAFEAAHALKGVLGNLSLTPLYNPVSEITELLRAKTDMDYTPLLNEILEQKKKFDALAE